MTAQSDDFRQAMASLAAGVSVVSCTRDGTDHAMTATAITSVSLEPPLLLVCVSRSARFWDAIGAAPFWAVSLLADDAAPHAAWLATRGRPLAGQLDKVPHRRSPHGCAWLEQSLAVVECRTRSRTRAGDHDIFLGEVLHAESAASQRGPLLYWRSRYRAASELESGTAGERYS